MNKKIILIIAINLALLFIGILVLDFIFFSEKTKGFSLPKYMTSFSKPVSFKEFYLNRTQKKHFRDVILYNDNYINNNDINKYTNKKPIILFGCSNTYGFGLNLQQTLGYKLAELSHRNVYNRAIPGLGIQHFVQILENCNIEKEIPEPEYIIYVYSACHNIRLYLKVLSLYNEIEPVLYSYENGELKLSYKNLSPLYRLYVLRQMLSTSDMKNVMSNRNYEKDFELIEALFLKANSLIKKKFPGCKFVILLYQDYDEPWFYEPEHWQKLKENGIIIMDSMKITNSKYLFSNEIYTLPDMHPNEHAWDVITPALVKELNL